MGNMCGIDEAGRGPIAGSLMVAGCILHKPLQELNDSKKLTEKKREALYKEIIKHSTYHVAVVNASTIDEIGIAQAMRQALKEIVKNLQADRYLFDGNTNFGINTLETMVKADGKVAEVSAASILAKVTHDRDIVEQGKLYPLYGFEKHKGYGTKAHIEAIKTHGYCPIHRRSYRVKALEKTLFDE